MDLRLITVAAQLGQGIQAPCSGRNPLNLCPLLGLRAGGESSEIVPI